MEVLTPKQEVGALSPLLERLKAGLEAFSETADQQAGELSLIDNIVDEDSRKAASEQVKASRKLLSTMKNQRMEVTRPLDDFKKEFLLIEKRIAGPVESQIDRVKGLMNQYEAELQSRLEEERKKREHEVKRNAEMLRVKAAVREALTSKIEQLVLAFENSLLRGVSSLTLPDFEERTAKLKNLTPRMSDQAYASIFEIDYDPTLLTSEEYAQIIEPMQGEYRHLRDHYEQRAGDILKQVIDSLPERKRQLETLTEEARKAEQEKLEAEMKARQEQQQREEAERKALMEKEQQEKEEALRKAAEKSLDPGRKVNVKYEAEVDLASAQTLHAILDEYLNRKELTGEMQGMFLKMATHLANNGRPEIQGLSYKIA
jgi:hypothetical protein